MSLLLLLPIALATNVDEKGPSDSKKGSDAAPQVERSPAVLATLYGSLPSDCEESTARSFPVDRYALGEDGSLLRVLCASFAYNATSAYFLQKPDGSIEQLSLSHPVYRFHLEKKGEIEHTVIDGIDSYKTENLVFNSAYDAITKTLSAYTKHRGVGDSFTEASWRWAKGSGFALASYAVDQSLDGHLTPAQVFPEPAPPLQLNRESAIAFVQENLRLVLKKEERIWNQLTDESLFPEGFWRFGFANMFPEGADIWSSAFPYSDWLNESWVDSMPSHISSVSEASTERIRDLRGFPLEDFTDPSKKPKNPPMAEVLVITIETATRGQERPRSQHKTQVILFENQFYWEPFGW
jgi:hypothetical protein